MIARLVGMLQGAEWRKQPEASSQAMAANAKVAMVSKNRRKLNRLVWKIATVSDISLFFFSAFLLKKHAHPCSVSS